MVATGVDGCLLVQHMGQFDNGYLASILRRTPNRHRAICLVDTDDPTAPKHLDAILSGRMYGAGFCGVRMTRAMIDRQPKCLDVLENHAATLVPHLPDGFGRHLDLLRRVADEFPRITIYVPHIGWPVAGGKVSPAWHAAVEALADLPRVVFGLSSPGDFSSREFPHEDVWPYMREVIANVGAERTVWASDSVMLAEGTVGDYLALLAGPALGLNAEELKAILGSTAARCWGFA